MASVLKCTCPPRYLLVIILLSSVEGAVLLTDGLPKALGAFVASVWSPFGPLIACKVP